MSSSSSGSEPVSKSRSNCVAVKQGVAVPAAYNRFARISDGPFSAAVKQHTIRCLTISKGMLTIAWLAFLHSSARFLKVAPGTQAGTCFTTDKWVVNKFLRA